MSQIKAWTLSVLIAVVLPQASLAAEGEGGPWWGEFASSGLSDAVEAVLAGNADLAAAQERIRAAKGSQLSSLSPVLPNVSFDLGLSGAPSEQGALAFSPQLADLFDQLSALQENFGGSDTTSDDEDKPETVWNGNAQLLFGFRFDMGSSVARARATALEAAASRGDRDELARLLAQQAATAWLDASAAALRTELIERQLDGHRALLQATKDRFEAGAATSATVLQQTQQVAQTEAMLPQARELQRLMAVRLATLAGRSLDQTLGGDLPSTPAEPSLGTPEDLSLARPDLRASAKRLTAAEQRSIAAGLAFAPTLSVQAGVGKRLRYYEDWATEDNWSVGASLNVPIFDGLQRAGQAVQASASRRAATQQHLSASRQAWAEVQSAQIRGEEGAARVTALVGHVEAAARARQRAESEYRAGTGDYLAAWTSIVAHQGAQMNLLLARRDELAARIDLFSALGAPASVRSAKKAVR